jgi:hypothetical protein
MQEFKEKNLASIFKNWNAEMLKGYPQSREKTFMIYKTFKGIKRVHTYTAL